MGSKGVLRDGEMTSPMSDMMLGVAKHRYLLGHQRLLQMLEGLTEEQFIWKPTPSSHAIAFNLWHLARTADFLQATIPGIASSLGAKLGRGREIWDTERLPQRRGWNPATLGWNQMGFQMDDQAAANLRFPRRTRSSVRSRRFWKGREEHAKCRAIRVTKGG